MPRAPPEKGVVGRQAVGKTLRIGKQQLFDHVDALEQIQRNMLDVMDRFQRSGLRVPDERVGFIEPIIAGLWWGQTLKCIGNAGKQGMVFLIGHGADPSSN